MIQGTRPFTVRRLPRQPVDPRRARLERAIEAAIALLDALDGDPDLEETGDAEPSLGRPETDFGAQQHGLGSYGLGDDREVDRLPVEAL